MLLSLGVIGRMIGCSLVSDEIVAKAALARQTQGLSGLLDTGTRSSDNYVPLRP